MSQTNAAAASSSSQVSSSEGTRSPQARLGLLDATRIGMGAMIGAGIFVLTGLAAKKAGPGAILVFALNGVVTTFTALSYAELASAIPKSGGGYAYIREVFSDPVAFVMGWTRWFTYIAAGALYALGFAPNFIEFVHVYWAGLPDWPVVYALLSVAGFVGLNAVSTEASGGADTIVSILKFGVLLIFAAFGFTAASSDAFTPFFPGNLTAMSMLPAMGLTFIAFQGYDLIATITEEVENPRKNIPRAILLSVAGAVVLYLLILYVAIGTIGADQLGAAGETGISQAAESFMPALPVIGTGAALIAFGAAFSMISALNAVVIGSSRIAFAMGREGQIPRRLGMIHHRYGTPFTALMVSGVLMLVAVVFAPIELVGNLSSLFSLLGFTIVNGAVIQLRRTRPNMQRPFEIPLYPLPPILGIACNLGLSIFVSGATWIIALAWLVLGAVAYFAIESARPWWVARHQPAGDEEETRTQERELREREAEAAGK